MRTIKVSELVLDFELYPRNNVDAFNVKQIAEAMAAGTEMPPVIVDRQSKRVIDGFHRCKAAIRLHGENAEIEVVEKTYSSEAAMFLDAMRLNASHGARLDPCDRVHCLILAERLKLTVEQVAGALHMTTDKLASLRADRTATSAGLTVPLKSTIRHFAGGKLNKRQAEANDRLSGMRQVFYVNQIIELVEAKLLDTTDGNLMARLEHLSELLEDVLAAK
jgi:hypothetical protein